MHIPLFRIWYSTTYTVLFLILLVLLAVTPADIIYQTIRANGFRNLPSIGGVYFLTAILTVFIYASRLYTNRTTIAAIPKPYIPIEKGEVGTSVRRMIVKHLERSAIIAWDSRPRDIRGEVQKDGGTGTRSAANKQRHSESLRKRHHHIHSATVVSVAADAPPWGHIAHPGWSSPASDEFPHLQYWTVIPELPHLIEAKAVSLAPPDPAVEHEQQHPHDATPILPDARVVAGLQRPATMGLRDYLSHLASFGLIQPSELGPTFVSQYEYARFSNRAITEEQFRELMATFAALLSGMTSLSPAVIMELQRSAPSEASSDTASLTPSASIASENDTGSAIHHHTPHASTMDDGATGIRPKSSTSSLRPASSVRTHSTISAITAPSRLRGLSDARSIARSLAASTASSDDTVKRKASAAEARMEEYELQRSGTNKSTAESEAAGREGSMRTSVSVGSGGSVIRLATGDGRSGGLPYKLMFGEDPTRR